MREWVNFDKIIAHRDFVMLDNDEIQGMVLVNDLPKVIEECDLHKLELLYYECERNIISRVYKTVYYDDGRVEKSVLFGNTNPDKNIDGIDPLNIFGRIIVNNAIMENLVNEPNN